MENKPYLCSRSNQRMKFSPYIKDLLQQKAKRELRLPADCEYLALDIESVTGEHIGVNTLKRLLGFIEDEREPRLSTLDIIARYLDFDNWDSLKCFDDKSNSSFNTAEDEIRVNDLSGGQRIQISYLPDRLLELEYSGEGRFMVKESQNSKLQIGDELIITHIVKGYPLLVSHVWREGIDLGAFTAGKAQGVSFKIL